MYSSFIPHSWDLSVIKLLLLLLLIICVDDKEKYNIISAYCREMAVLAGDRFALLSSFQYNPMYSGKCRSKCSIHKTDR